MGLADDDRLEAFARVEEDRGDRALAGGEAAVGELEGLVVVGEDELAVLVRGEVVVGFGELLVVDCGGGRRMAAVSGGVA